MAEVKSYDFVKDYFSDPTVPVAAIKSIMFLLIGISIDKGQIGSADELILLL